MIRKAIILVLTLAAVGIASGNVIDGKQTVLRGYGIFREPRIAVAFGHWQLILFCFVTDDPRKPDVDFSWTRIGFKRGRMYLQPTGAYYETMYAVFCPSLLVIALLATYPAIAFVRGPLRRHRRRRRGLCLKCGYDLTGNISGVCPECGTKVRQR